MEINDLVMFKPEGVYAEWFGGKMAIVENVSYCNDGKLHCRVRWLQPVMYFDRCTSVSDFAAERFEVCKNEDRKSS